jgi:hypothetical protein
LSNGPPITPFDEPTNKVAYYEKTIAHVDRWQLAQAFLACRTRETLVAMEVAR